MLIKAVTKKGDAVPYTAEEAAKSAVMRAVKSKNTQEKIMWVDKKSIKVEKFQSLVDKNRKWEAWAEGTVDIGHTTTHDDKFHIPRKHTFKIHYKMGKDEIGLPDITLGPAQEFTEVPRNPKNVGAAPKPAEPSVGELQVQEGGKTKPAKLKKSQDKT